MASSLLKSGGNGLITSGLHLKGIEIQLSESQRGMSHKDSGNTGVNLIRTARTTFGMSERAKNGQTNDVMVFSRFTKSRCRC